GRGILPPGLRLEPLAGEREEGLGDAAGRPTDRADERDLAGGLEALHARERERTCGELRLDRRARDEGDAVPGDDGALHRLLEAELEVHVEVPQLEAGGAKLLLDHRPHA